MTRIASRIQARWRELSLARRFAVVGALLAAPLVVLFVLTAERAPGMASLALAAALAGLGVGFFAVRALARQLGALAESARRLHPDPVLAAAGDEVRQLGQALDAMAEALQAARASSEAHTAQLAHAQRALQVAAEVSQRLANSQDQRRLASEVVEQVRAAFDYYHVRVYVFDNAREHLVLVGASGEIGQALLAEGYRLPAGHGLPGRAAETNLLAVENDLAGSPGQENDGRLPDSRCQMAVPIAAGERVLGVLDVHHRRAHGLQAHDADFLRAIASQLAVALQSARTYAEAQRKAGFEALVNSINQKIQSTVTVESALQTAVRELGWVLGAKRTSVQLGVAANAAERD